MNITKPWTLTLHVLPTDLSVLHTHLRDAWALGMVDSPDSLVNRVREELLEIIELKAAQRDLRLGDTLRAKRLERALWARDQRMSARQSADAPAAEASAPAPAPFNRLEGRQ